MFGTSISGSWYLYLAIQVTIFTCDVLWVQGLLCPIGSLTVLSSSFKKGYKCINCSEYGPCPEGHGWSVVCDTTVTNETSIECLECVEGKSFSPTYDHSQCQDCQSTSCLMHEKVEGKCTIEKDSTVCMGVCKKGFFMNSNKTRCLPCSTCQSGNTVIKNCSLDGMPKEMQCRPQGSLPKENCTMDEFGVIGHPASFGVLVAVVAVSLLVIVICTCIYCRRSQQQSVVFSQHGDPEIQLSDQSKDQKSNNASTASTEERTQLLPSVQAEVQESARIVPELTEVVASLSTPGGTPDSTRRKSSEKQNLIQLVNLKTESPVAASEINHERNDHIDSSGQVVITKKNLRVGDLDGRIYDKLCQKLNLPIVNKNWKALGGLMKYSNDDLKIFEQKDDPADALLANWGTKFENDVNRLVELLKEMERDDLVKLL